MLSRSIRGAIAPGVLTCALFAAAASAQTVLPTREELDPARRAPAAPLAREAAPLFSQPASGPCPFETSGLRLTLAAVELRGATTLGAEVLEPAYQALIGREIGLAEACRIRDRIADLYFDSGYLARVEIPEQTIRDGRLVLDVIEARIADVRVTGDAGPAQARVERLMKRLEGLAPFDMRVVQRQLLLASDIPGMQVKVNVRPSDAGRGAVGLDVAVERNAADAVAVVQNFGSKEVGPWTLLGRLDLNSLTPLGERTSIVVSASSDFDEQRVAQLIEEIRLGDSGLLLRGSVAYGESRPGGALAPLALDGESLVTNLELSYPLVRRRRENLFLSAGLETADQSTDFGAARLIDDELRVAFARLEGDKRGRIGSNGYAFAGRLEIRKGFDGLGASDAGSPTLSRADAKPDAFVLRADARGEVAVAPRLSVAAAMLAQWSDDPLLAYEEVSIGNYTIGRGYDPSQVTGDRGIAASVEARLGPFDLSPSVPASLFGFYDIAHVENLDTGAGTQTVDSIGGGLRLRLNGRADLTLTYAHPLDDIAGADDRLLVNLIVRLF